MAKINQIIQTQGYELIRNKTGEIIIIELFNQSALTYDEDLDATVYVERFISVSHDEMPVINISLANGTFDSFKQTNHDGKYIFNIDFYVNAISETDVNGNVIEADVSANFKLQKLMGVVKSIIMNPIYRTLDFAPPFIIGRTIDEMNIQDPNKFQEATSSVMGRLIMTVKCVETLELITPILLQQNNTNVKLALTDKGFRYDFIN